MKGSAQLPLALDGPRIHERLSRRARRIRVEVRADGDVVLTIPRHASRRAAYRFLEESRDWIGRQRTRRAAVPVPAVQWHSVEAPRAVAEREARRLLDEESARLGLHYASFTLRDPRTRWGSCAPDGRIMLSWRLVLAPPDVFRYVVIHELCHLRWRGHGPRFWQLVARQMPDFAIHRAWLRRHGDALLSRTLENPAP